MNSKRIRFIDVGRGTAMLFVCLAHFSEAYLHPLGELQQLRICSYFTLIASPTFMLISGMMLGYLYCTKSGNFEGIRLKLTDRGLFLITIAHVLIFIAFIPFMRSSGITVKVTFVTDSIGISMILGVLLIQRISKHYRLLLSALLYAGSTYLASLGKADFPGIGTVHEALTGSFFHASFFDSFPLIQWLSIYLAGSVIGERLGNYQKTDELLKVRSFFLKLGFAGLALSVLLYAAWHYGRQNEFIDTFLRFYRKNPPGLLYFVFYGSCGIFLLVLLDYIIKRKPTSYLIRKLEIMGQVSLFVFIVQYFLYFFVISLLKIPYISWWPLIYVFSMVIIMAAATEFHKRGLNRYITVLNFASVWFSGKNKVTEK